MEMENDLDAGEERGKNVIKRGTKGEKWTIQGHKGRDLQTTYYANDATIRSQFLAGSFLLIVRVLNVL